MESEHMKFASELGSLMACAKLAAENPDLDKKLGFWSKLPVEKRQKLLNIGSDLSLSDTGSRD